MIGLGLISLDTIAGAKVKVETKSYNLATSEAVWLYFSTVPTGKARMHSFLSWVYLGPGFSEIRIEIQDTVSGVNTPIYRSSPTSGWASYIMGNTLYLPSNYRIAVYVAESGNGPGTIWLATTYIEVNQEE